jgi:2-polyprenyl-6-methoxyphenol hydroxylase-like FAD-dependent oxidoreductase
VLVVGAGPTGLLLASELQRRRVPCELIDARPAPLHWDRATVVHPRSLEVLESLGLIGRFLDAGTPQRAAKIHSDGSLLGAVDLSCSGSSYPFNLGMSEEVTESILTDYLHEQGGEVSRSSRLVGLTPHSDGVLADVERNGDRDQVEAGWVVGCDGLHSATRDAVGIGLEGHDIAEPWAVFDATAKGWTEAFDAIFVYFDAIPVILTPLPGRRWRVYLRPTSADSDLVDDAASTIRRYYPASTFVEVENPRRFHCHSMVAARFRSGPILLAGDAGHLCSPAQGHGMNTGLQDAANLAWKLALVYEGAAEAALLDSYEAERRPIAEAVARSGDDIERAMTLTDPGERETRDEAIRARLADPASRHHEAAAEAELNVDYSESPIVSGDADDQLAPGQRLPQVIDVQPAGAGPCRLHELTHRAGHTLVLLGSPTADLVSATEERANGSPLFEAFVQIGWLDPAAAGVLGIRGTTLLAVRPDGYIGLRADAEHLTALERYHALIRNGHP